MNNVVKSPVKSPARALGKGLLALMSDSYSQMPAPAPELEAAPQAMEGATLELALDVLQPGKYQPRDHFAPLALQELAESIRENGVVQPIIVRQLKNGLYEIIAGERRWRAAKLAGYTTIPALIREFDDKKALEIALVENVQREDLNPLEEATGYQRLMKEFRYTQEELATAVHKSRSHIANLLRLLELPNEIRSLLVEQKISMGHARALFGVPDAVALAQQIIDRNLNVRETEKLARFGKGQTHEARPRKAKSASNELVTPAPTAVPAPPTPHPVEPENKGPRDPDILALEETLSENLGLKVSINDRGASGEILIAYASLEQLDDILRRLVGSV